MLLCHAWLSSFPQLMNAAAHCFLVSQQMLLCHAWLSSFPQLMNAAVQHPRLLFVLTCVVAVIHLETEVGMHQSRGQAGELTHQNLALHQRHPLLSSITMSVKKGCHPGCHQDSSWLGHSIRIQVRIHIFGYFL